MHALNPQHSPTPDDHLVVLTAEDFDVLRAVAIRLYSPRTLDYEVRLDLAKVMDGVLQRAFVSDSIIFGG